jgi:plastocyanin
MTGIHPRWAVPAVVLLLACVGCGGGGGGYNAPTTPSSQPSGPAPSPTDVSIAIVADAGAQSFNPNPSSVRMGQTVAWRNTDTLVHHIVEDSADTGPGGDGGYGPVEGGGTSGFDGGQEAPGAVSSTLTARTAGTMHYHCSIHPGMVGTLTVTP